VSEFEMLGATGDRGALAVHRKDIVFIMLQP
jgi:hypothetical protein